MSPQQQERQAKIPAGRDGWGGPDRERVAWQRAEERWEWEQLQRRRGKALGELEKRSKREWSALYGCHQQQREYLAKDCRGALGRFRLWRELGGKVREIGGAIRGDKEVLGRFRAELEDRLRWQRVSLGKEHSEAVRGIESKAGEFYREGLEGSEKRAREAARSNGISVRYGWHRDEFDTFKYSMLEERLEQVREIDGEPAYEKMRRAVEKASQEKARQVESRPERRGPERGGPERDFGRRSWLGGFKMTRTSTITTLLSYTLFVVSFFIAGLSTDQLLAQGYTCPEDPNWGAVPCSVHKAFTPGFDESTPYHLRLAETNPQYVWWSMEMFGINNNIEIQIWHNHFESQKKIVNLVADSIAILPPVVLRGSSYKYCD